MQIQCARQLGKEVTTLEKEVRAIEFDDLSNREAVVARKYFQLIFDKTFVRTEFNPINVLRFLKIFLKQKFQHLMKVITKIICQIGSIQTWMTRRKILRF